jgi:hypothetical protein
MLTERHVRAGGRATSPDALGTLDGTVREGGPRARNAQRLWDSLPKRELQGRVLRFGMWLGLGARGV